MEIQKNVPIPKKPVGRGSASGLNIPFADMEAGDSVLVMPSDCQSQNFRALVKVTVHRARGSMPGKSFTLRKDGEGYRVWRTK